MTLLAVRREQRLARSRIAVGDGDQGLRGRALGAQATLPNLFSMKAEDLAGRMEAWRRAAAGTLSDAIAAQPQLVS